MSILMIHGPEEPDPRANLFLPGVEAAMSERAANAGKVLMRYRCGSEAEVIERLREAASRDAEIILLDPGRCVPASESLRAALAQLDVPYIEVHDDHPDALESVMQPAGRRVTVINGFGAQSFTQAMSVALEKIGCAECEYDYHVGT